MTAEKMGAAADAAPNEGSSSQRMVTERMVQCAKLGQLLPGLEKPPLRGDNGQLIFEKISKQAWQMWKEDMQIKVLNEYRLNMGDPKDYAIMVEHMLTFLNLKSGTPAEVENAERGRSSK